MFQPVKTASEFSRQRGLPLGQVLLLATSLGGFAVIHLRGLASFSSQFPGSYTWTDLLINYQGGFVRRGLLGELAFHSDRLLPARALLTCLMGAAYLLVAIWGVWIASRVHLGVGLLFLLSPVAILFPIHDFDAFGRKDIFVLLAFVLATLGSKKCSSVSGLGTAMSVYLVAGFIHEAAWCYFPLALAMVLVEAEAKAAPVVPRPWFWRSTSSDLQARLLLVGGLYLAACLGLMVATNRIKSDPALISDQQRAIMDSWREIYPAAYNHAGAVGFLGLSLRDGVGLVITHQSSAVTLQGYVAAFLLGIAPVILVLTTRKLVATQWLTRVTAGCAILAAAVPFLTAADWGRYTYLFVVHVFGFVVLATREPDADQRGRWALRASLDQTVIWVMLIGLNSTMWQVKHFRQHGLSAFMPGIAFQVLSSQESPP